MRVNKASRVQKLISLRSSLLSDIAVRAGEQFNAVMNKFMSSELFLSHKECADKELKNQTFLKIRECGSIAQSFSVEEVFIVLTNFGWVTRLADDRSNSDLRSLVPTVRTSTSPYTYNLTMHVQDENSGNDAEIEDKCEGNERHFSLESIPDTFNGAINWACSDRTLRLPFRSFMAEYSQWTQKSENATLLNVKERNDIKVPGTSNVVLSLCGHPP